MRGKSSQHSLVISMAVNHRNWKVK